MGLSFVIEMDNGMDCKTFEELLCGNSDNNINFASRFPIKPDKEKFLNPITREDYILCFDRCNLEWSATPRGVGLINEDTIVAFPKSYFLENMKETIFHHLKEAIQYAAFQRGFMQPNGKDTILKDVFDLPQYQQTLSFGTCCCNTDGESFNCKVRLANIKNSLFQAIDQGCLRWLEICNETQAPERPDFKDVQKCLSNNEYPCYKICVAEIYQIIRNYQDESIRMKAENEDVEVGKIRIGCANITFDVIDRFIRAIEGEYSDKKLPLDSILLDPFQKRNNLLMEYFNVSTYGEWDFYKEKARNELEYMDQDLWSSLGEIEKRFYTFVSQLDKSEYNPNDLEIMRGLMPEYEPEFPLRDKTKKELFNEYNMNIGQRMKGLRAAQIIQPYLSSENVKVKPRDRQFIIGPIRDDIGPLASEDDICPALILRGGSDTTGIEDLQEAYLFHTKIKLEDKLECDSSAFGEFCRKDHSHTALCLDPFFKLQTLLELQPRYHIALKRKRDEKREELKVDLLSEPETKETSSAAISDNKFDPKELCRIVSEAGDTFEQQFKALQEYCATHQNEIIDMSEYLEEGCASKAKNLIDIIMMNTISKPREKSLTVPDTNISTIESIIDTDGSKNELKNKKVLAQILSVRKKGAKKKGVNETKDALENSKEESNQSTDGSIQYISENNNDTPVTYDILDHTVKNSMRKQEATILTDLQKEFVNCSLLNTITPVDETHDVSDDSGFVVVDSKTKSKRKGNKQKVKANARSEINEKKQNGIPTNKSNAQIHASKHENESNLTQASETSTRVSSNTDNSNKVSPIEDSEYVGGARKKVKKPAQELPKSISSEVHTKYSGLSQDEISTLETKTCKELKALNFQVKEIDSSVQQFIEQMHDKLGSIQGRIDKIEDRAHANDKQVAAMDDELNELAKRMERIRSDKKRVESENVELKREFTHLTDERKNLEELVESDIKNMKEKKENTLETITKLEDNLKLMNMAKESKQVTSWNPGVDPSASNPKNTESNTSVQSSPVFLEFIRLQIAAKESDLECPVCMEVSQPPIYTCPEQHLICSLCWNKVKMRSGSKLPECVQCRSPYPDPPRHHRYMEKVAEELNQLYVMYAKS